jgi:5-methylcytosine-specific restriction endonuclease McrA
MRTREDPEVIKARSKSYYEANRELLAEKNAVYRATHREELSLKNKVWRAANAEVLAVKDAARRAKNREKAKATTAAWRLANPDREKTNHLKWYAENRDVAIARQAAWQRKHPVLVNEAANRHRARKLNSQIGSMSQVEVQAKWDYWAGQCWMCGTQATAWDHVKPLSKGGTHTLANLRPACKPCNSSKSAKWPFRLAA